MKEVSEDGLAAVIGGADGPGGGRRRFHCYGGNGFGLGGARVLLFWCKYRVRLGVVGFPLLLAKPRGGID
jgi:hypothetical protein